MNQHVEVTRSGHVLKVRLNKLRICPPSAPLG